MVAWPVKQGGSRKNGMRGAVRLVVGLGLGLNDVTVRWDFKILTGGSRGVIFFANERWSPRWNLSAEAAPGVATKLLCASLMRHRDGIGLSEVDHRKPGALAPPQTVAIGKVDSSPR